MLPLSSKTCIENLGHYSSLFLNPILSFKIELQRSPRKSFLIPKLDLDTSYYKSPITPQLPPKETLYSLLILSHFFFWSWNFPKNWACVRQVHCCYFISRVGYRHPTKWLILQQLNTDFEVKLSRHSKHLTLDNVSNIQKLILLSPNMKQELTCRARVHTALMNALSFRWCFL